MRRKGIQYRSAEDFVPCLSKAAANVVAAKVADQLAFKPGGDVFELVERLGGRAHYADFAATASSDTIFVHGPRDFDIVLSFGSTARRDRFTVAHELGHYLIHSSQGENPIVARRDGSTRAEWEANWFAAGFLMPYETFKTDSTRMSVETLAEKYQVSVPAIEIRKKSLGLAE